MRKISLVLAGVLASYNCFADLGQITIKSYLDQPLYATIPIYNVAGGDYANLSINLATSDKFKNYGIAYDSDLGLLQFKVINQGSSHYLQITSSRSISAPVLNVLLHYQEDNNDFYRQYTILLNPIQYGANGYQSNTTSPTANRNNPIGIYGKSKQVTKPLSQKYKGAFAMDLKNEFVKSHLSQFNQDNMTFNMKAGDNLYVPAHFIQAIYPKAKLPINQVALALGLANYHDLKDKNYIYESDFSIKLPTPQQIMSIPTELVDAYVWSSDKNVEQNIDMLTKMASKFDSAIEISGDPTIFAQGNSVAAPAAKVNASKVVSSNVVNKPTVAPVSYDEPDLIDEILDYKLEIAGALLALVGILVLLKKRKSKPSKPVDSGKKGGIFNKKKKSKVESDTDNLENDLDILSNPEPVIQIQPRRNVSQSSSQITTQEVKYNQQVADLHAVTNNHRIQNEEISYKPPVKIQEVVKPVVEIEYPASTSPYAVAPVIDDVPEFNHVEEVKEEVHASTVSQAHSNNEVIDTLEQILSLDSSRNDIRLKLFELYINAHATDKANECYSSLNAVLDFDDPLRRSLEELTAQYNFVYHMPNNVMSKATVNAVVESNVKQPEVNLSSISPVASNVSNNSVEYFDMPKSASVEIKVEEPIVNVKHLVEDIPVITTTMSIEPEKAIATPVISAAPVASYEHHASTNSNSQYEFGASINEEEHVVTKIDKDIAGTLEQILSFDTDRDDIRLKLFEMYASARMINQASKYYSELDFRLDIDSPLRISLNSVAMETHFKSSSTTPDSYSLNPSAHSSSGMSFSNSTVSPVNHHDDLNYASGHVMEFSSSNIEPAAHPVVEQHKVVSEDSNPFANTTIEQKMNLATMYYHIDEFVKAKDVLKDIINSPHATYEQKESAMKLMTDYHLNG